MDTTFASLGVAADLCRQLDRLGFRTPTPIQAQAIPVTLTGRDVIGVAQTGTGKTFAFGLPVIQRLSRASDQALVLVPTRELADQVESSLQSIGRAFGLRTALLIGGAAFSPQRVMLHRRPHVIVATPGRLVDHLEQKTTNLSRVSILVLDEADRMLDMGFAPQVNRILAAVPAVRQTLLFSATIPPSITALAERILRDPITIAVAPSGTTVATVDQSLLVVGKAEKFAALQQVLATTTGPCLVFVRTKFGARKLCRLLVTAGFRSEEIHGNRSLPQRRAALAAFKAGRAQVLVATDIAARGIDVTGIALVLNYDLPMQVEDYIHRIGRTARAGRAGRAVTFASPDQARDVRMIERLIGVSLVRITGSKPLESAAAIARPKSSSYPFRRQPSRPRSNRPWVSRLTNRPRSAPFIAPVRPPVVASPTPSSPYLI